MGDDSSDSGNAEGPEKQPLLNKSGKEPIQEFPYKKTRLRPQDYKMIIARGEKYNDPTFPHGPQALFINGEHHQGHSNWEYKAGEKFYWRRATDHFKDKGCRTLVFDGIDPTDII